MNVNFIFHRYPTNYSQYLRETKAQLLLACYQLVCVHIMHINASGAPCAALSIGKAFGFPPPFFLFFLVVLQRNHACVINQQKMPHSFNPQQTTGERVLKQPIANHRASELTQKMPPRPLVCNSFLLLASFALRTSLPLLICFCFSKKQYLEKLFGRTQLQYRSPRIFFLSFAILKSLYIYIIKFWRV